jgi:hypothetical protein
LTKNARNFRPVGGISTLKRPNHSILYAERSARQIKRRHKRHNWQTGIIRRFLTKTLSEFRPVGDIWTFKRPNHSILYAERSARQIKRRHKRNNWQTGIIRRFLTKTLSEIRPVGDISTVKPPNHSMIPAERRARRIKRRDKRNNSQIAIIRRFLTQNARNCRPVGDISTSNHQITPSYTQNVEHAELSVDTSATTRKPRSFVDF